MPYSSEDKITQLFIESLQSGFFNKVVEDYYKICIDQMEKDAKPSGTAPGYSPLPLANKLVTDITNLRIPITSRITLLHRLVYTYVAGKDDYAAHKDEPWYEPAMFQLMQDCVKLCRLAMVNLIIEAIKDTD